MFTAWAFPSTSWNTRLGQLSTHVPQPVQSSGFILITIIIFPTSFRGKVSSPPFPGLPLQPASLLVLLFSLPAVGEPCFPCLQQMVAHLSSAARRIETHSKG